MQIKLVTIEGCSRCQRLKDLLSRAAIRFHFTTCEQDPDNCDSLEALVGEVNYPMVLMTNTNGDVFEVLFLTDSYLKLDGGAKNSGGILCIPYHSIDNIVQYVKNKLHL